MANKQEIMQQMTDLIRDVLRYEGPITEETSFTKDMDADSLDLMELIMAVEETFDVEVEDDVLKTIHTVGDVVRYLAK